MKLDLPLLALAVTMSSCLVGCSSTQQAASRVALPAPIDEFCFRDVIASADGVRGFRRIPQHGHSTYWFRVDVESASGEDAPGFMAFQRSFAGRWRVQIESGFDAGLLNEAALRTEVLDRQQSLLSQAFDSCTDMALRFGPERPCGNEDDHSVCVDAEVVPKSGSR